MNNIYTYRTEILTNTTPNLACTNLETFDYEQTDALQPFRYICLVYNYLFKCKTSKHIKQFK